MRPNRTALTILFAIVFLFFLQALSDFIQSIYAFGLLVTAFTPQLAAVLLLFSPVALLFVRKEPSRRWMIGLGAVAVVGRLVEPLLDPGGRLVTSGISVGAFMLLFPMMLAQSRSTVFGWQAAWGLLLSVMASIFVRTAGSSLDITETGATQIVAWVMAAVAVWLARRYEWRGQESEPSSVPSPDEGRRAPEDVMEAPSEAQSHEERREASLRALAERTKAAEEGQPLRTAEEIASVAALPRNDGETGRVVGFWVGLAAVIVMLYFAFANPGVMARWTGYSYEAIVLVTAVAWGIAGAAEGMLGWWNRLSRGAVLGWNALFVAMLVLSILPHQVAFPVDQGAYPFEPGAVSALWQIPLYVMLVLSPVIVVDFMLFLGAVAAERPTIRQLGGGFAIGALFVLVMVFLQVFTTIYDYAKPIGPVFRDRSWLVYLIAGVGMATPVFGLRGGGNFEFGIMNSGEGGATQQTAAEDGGGSEERRENSDGRRMKNEGEDAAAARQRAARWTPLHGPGGAVWMAVGLAVLTGAALVVTGIWQVSQPSAGALRVMTYNIQQGFDKVGDEALPGQLEAIRHVEPDVLGIEESDTARVANGNVDAVRYFANHLRMYSYYGPPTTVGTFGIALLSKYPIENPHTFYMYSAAEQTACIEAQITANGKTYNVFVTHLGNGGPMVQLDAVLTRVNSAPNVILMGDFNFDPLTAQYAQATDGLDDAWLLRWPGGKQLTGPGAEGRIDQMFVSPGTEVTDAEYVPNPSSDHPYLWAVVR